MAAQIILDKKSFGQWRFNTDKQRRAYYNSPESTRDSASFACDIHLRQLSLNLQQIFKTITELIL